MPLMLWHGVPCLKGVTPQSKDAGRLQALWQPYPTSREPERDKAVGPPPRSLSSLTVILPMPASRHPSPLGNMHQLHPTLPRVNLTAPPPRARTLMLHRTVKVTHGGPVPQHQPAVPPCQPPALSEARPTRQRHTRHRRRRLWPRWPRPWMSGPPGGQQALRPVLWSGTPQRPGGRRVGRGCPPLPEVVGQRWLGISLHI